MTVVSLCLQQVPSTLTPQSRDANSLSAAAAAAYSAADMAKFRTDQNSSPVPSAISTQVSCFLVIAQIFKCFRLLFIFMFHSLLWIHIVLLAVGVMLVTMEFYFYISLESA